MAVPKKRTSKSKTHKRKFVWKNKALKQVLNAFSLSKLEQNIKNKNIKKTFFIQYR